MILIVKLSNDEAFCHFCVSKVCGATFCLHSHSLYECFDFGVNNFLLS